MPVNICLVQSIDRNRTRGCSSIRGLITEVTERKRLDILAGELVPCNQFNKLRVEAFMNSQENMCEKLF